MNDKILSLLGIARRAGKLSPGHDASIDSIVKNKSKLCILCLDSSERLKKEISHACTYNNKNVPVVHANFEMSVLSKAIGTKAAVITVDDDGFAKKLSELFETITQGKE